MQTVSLLFVLVRSILAKTVRPTQGFASLRPKPVTLAPFVMLGRWGLSVRRDRHIAWIFASGAEVLHRRRNDRFSSSTSSSAICNETISCAWKLYGLQRVLRPSYKALFMDENSIKAPLDGENSIAQRVQTTRLGVASEMI